VKKLLLFPLLITFLSSCSYGSYFEAYSACQKWREKKGYRNYDCRDDSATNKILGRDTSADLSRDYKVLKRFKY